MPPPGKSRAKYELDIAKGLTRALDDASAVEGPPFVLGRDRMILFSDLHKGGRDAADDFRRCERAYNAALAYYHGMGYWLAEVGDVEELWEERPKTVLEKYARTMDLSAQFHRSSTPETPRYTRIWGNHDDEWNREDKVKKFLGPIYDPQGTNPLRVYGSILIPIQQPAGTTIGHLFLAHGHQGTVESDKMNWFSRLVVRHLWRPFQRLTNTSLNTPATDWELNYTHNIAMGKWLAGLPREDLIFISGHTHRPVFLSHSHQQLLVERLNQATDQEEVATLTAELEWERGQRPEAEGIDPLPPGVRRYFNIGCAAYSDGDVTGIEINDRDIRLVRWPDDKDRPSPQILASAPLRSLLP